MPLPDPATQPDALSDAMLLAITGGLLDAVVFLLHGNVFASSMTGNVVFLGIVIVTQRWIQIIPHLAPILGFFAGITTSKHLRSRFGIRALLLSLILEIAAIFLLGWLPANFPEILFTAIIAYVAAVQVASFRRVDNFAFNSTFATGNLRDVAEGLYDAIRPKASRELRNKGRAEARDLGLISLCFLAGAVLGAWAAPRFHNHSLWLAEPLLLIVATHCRRHNQTLTTNH
jgi:uncharacterized membrane protein YoaK (UPF0700 family)